MICLSVSSPSLHFGVTHLFFGVEELWRTPCQHKGPSGQPTKRDKLIVFDVSRVLWKQMYFVCRVLHVIIQRCVLTKSLNRFDWLRQFSSISECPWPSITVGCSVYDGDRILVCQNRFKIDLCGSRNDFDWNDQKLFVRIGLQQLQPNR